jgi:hypothetical protein
MNNLIYKKMSEVMKDIGAIGKDQKNTVQGFKFRGIDQFVNALHPALNRHGVFMTPRATHFTQEVKDVTRSNGKAGVDKHVSIMMEYDFWAEDGSKVTVGPIPAEGVDSGDKATNKALSASLKYALIQTFSIPTEDMAEADLDSPELGRTTKITQQTKTTGTVTVGTVAAPLSVASSSELNAEFDAIPAPTANIEPLKKSTFRRNNTQTQSAAQSTAQSSDAGGWD